jgi:hypothetical protein
MSESVLRMTPLTFPQNLFRIYNSEEEERGLSGSPALIVFQLSLFSFPSYRITCLYSCTPSLPYANRITNHLGRVTGQANQRHEAQCNQPFTQ